MGPAVWECHYGKIYSADGVLSALYSGKFHQYHDSNVLKLSQEM